LNVIPAKAGISENTLAYCIFVENAERKSLVFKMGTQRFLKKNKKYLDEIPAFAGMTVRTQK
jgi:hypothetical protein